jgi:hypothetical protein
MGPIECPLWVHSENEQVDALMSALPLIADLTAETMRCVPLEHRMVATRTDLVCDFSLGL